MAVSLPVGPVSFPLLFHILALIHRSIVTGGNQLLVQFVSDLSVTSDGFMASYSSIPRGSKSPTREGDTWPASGAESIPPKPKPGPRVESVPLKPDTKPKQPPGPPITVTTTTPTTTTTPAPGVPSLPETEKLFVKPKTPQFRPKPAKPIKPNQNRTIGKKPSKYGLTGCFFDLTRCFIC